MTEEELKDGICEYVHNLHKVEPFNGFSYRDLRDVAEHFALPREKRIAELETRCNELFLQTCEQAEKIKELNAEIENDRDLPAIAYMQGAEKQKKKDEEELKKWKDEWQEQVQKATDEGYARTLQTIQLSKVKEIIKNLMVYVPVDLKEYEEAEQFLKDSEVKK